MKEKALKSGNGNLFKNNVPTSGKLHLTSEAIYHIPQAMNLDRKETKIMLEEIEQVKVINFKVLKLIPITNGLQVTLRDGRNMRFIVNGRKRWKKHIEQALTHRGFSDSIK
ncbi:hypothetical protein GCM10022378_16890 [Salinicoccus jeotgali]|uniref:GRAM domain-containing protein n=1 Tax=Salinicoccus jeotgali TaxID=381634 RepID=A0ABP7F072_9STAP